MTSNRPYLVRAIYEWLIDNGMTPHLLVDATKEGVEVPQQFVENDQIVLNINPSAVRDIELGNEFISFGARFSGRPMEVFVPVEAVMGIYAQENNQGMLFGAEEVSEEPDPDPQPPEPPKPKRPQLKVIK